MPQKILVIRFSSIGDIVLTTPVLRCLKQQTGAEIHFLTKRSFAGIVQSNPYVDKVIAIEKDIKEVARTLVQSKYDGIVDLHGNLRTLEVKGRLLGASLLTRHRRPRIRTFNKLNFRKFLLTKFQLDRMPEVHIVQRYLAAAADFGATDDGKGLDYFIPPEAEVDLAKNKLPTNYLAFVIGAAHATKRLTEEQMRRFCQQYKQPIVLLGGPAEKEIGKRLAADLPHVHNACGGFNLNGSASLVRQAQLVLTHDTGLMHIAAAFARPIISVWGNTVPALGMYPYLPGQQELERQRRREVLDLPCRPCSKIGYAECPKGHFNCIRRQSATDLVEACRRVLNGLR